MSYYTESIKPSSEKVILITCDSVERLKLFTLNGADYERQVSYFVVGVKTGSTPLSQGTLPLSINEYFFEPLTKTLSVNVGANPKTVNLSVTYRHFFSNTPVILPYDLSSGASVEWLPLVNSIGAIGQQLDEENVGIVLESSSTVSLINRDGYFDEIFDTLIWENQSVMFYSWFPNILVTEKITLFDGSIESKTFSETSISFRVKDFVYRLKTSLSLGVFTESDGIILPSILEKPKRRIYGRVDNCQVISLDATLDGYPLSGTLSGTVGFRAVTGAGTLFLSEVSVGDELIYVSNGVSGKVGVESIQSNTALTLGSDISVSMDTVVAKNIPAVPYREKNRTWSIAGHKLREPSVAITAIVSQNGFTVSSTDDFFSGDFVTVNGILSTISRVSGLTIFTTTNIVPPPVVSNLIIKQPVTNAYFGPKELLLSRDFTISNSTESKIILSNLAEFNIAQQVTTLNQLLFTNSSRTITTTDVVDLRATIKPRDWIRSSSLSEPTWYEVLEVKAQEIIIRVAFTGATATKFGYYKSVELINENSLITVNCTGMEYENKWIKTASDAVRHLMLNDAGFNVVNEATFTQAKADSDYILSMVLPETIGGESPKIRDVSSKINESVFGSLYGDNSQNISYSVLNAIRPTSADVLRDDDILSFSVTTNQKIINEARINYRPYVDIFTGGPANRSTTYNSSFVDSYIGIVNLLEKTAFLYETDKAQILAQRHILFKSLSSSVIKIKAKMNLAQKLVNEKIYISFDRLFKRYAGRDSKKIGSISGISNNGTSCELTVTDLGNIYNRVAAYAPSTASPFLSASDDDKILWGFYLDTDTETPDPLDENGIGSGLIG
jgi:hypothetical protein